MKNKRTVSFVPFVIPALFILLWHVAAVKANNHMVVPPLEQVGLLFSSPFASIIGMGSRASNIISPARRDAVDRQRSSDGMRQRVAIARSLAAEPDVLLMDEPIDVPG